MFLNDGIYKLYNPNVKKLKKFLSECDIIYNLIETEDEVKLEYNLNNLSTIEKDKFYKKFIENFNDSIFAEKDISLEEQLVSILKMRGIMISVAESFTGGLLSSTITKVSGASSVFYEGIVSYNQLSKNKRLCVDERTLRVNFPVSREVAHQMAIGLLKDSLSDLAISTTGIAGPNSDESGYPVGLCFFCVASLKKSSVYKYQFTGNREEITKKGVKTALFLAIKALRDGSFDI